MDLNLNEDEIAALKSRYRSSDESFNLRQRRRKFCLETSLETGIELTLPSPFVKRFCRCATKT